MKWQLSPMGLGDTLRSCPISLPQKHRLRACPDPTLLCWKRRWKDLSGRCIRTQANPWVGFAAVCVPTLRRKMLQEVEGKVTTDPHNLSLEGLALGLHHPCLGFPWGSRDRNSHSTSLEGERRKGRGPLGPGGSRWAPAGGVAASASWPVSSNALQRATSGPGPTQGEGFSSPGRTNY